MGELEEKENAPASDPQNQENDEPKETDKMLDKKDDEQTTNSVESERKLSTTSIKSTSTPIKNVIKTDEKKEINGEEIINIPEQENPIATNDDNDIKNAVTKEGREVKPKKIPIGGIKMPGFFTKIKPRFEGDGAEGELLENDGNNDKDKVIAEDKAKKDDLLPSIGERIRNFFSRKPIIKKKEENKINETATTGENEGPPPKKGLLNAIKLPIANMIPKKTEDDVELGSGPGTKAGLASMETLDDSLKDQDTVDRVPKTNDESLDKTKAVEVAKAKDEKSPEEKPEETISYLDRIKSYKCSVDDGLIVLGVFLFILLLGVICYVIMYEGTTSAPVREGKYIDAVTSCGMVEGLREEGAFAFRGIPYALPPIGNNRWKHAQLIENIENCWNGTFKAHNSSDVCIQILSNGTKIGKEDCLTLDIVTPQVRYDNPIPVIVLIGAESLTGGSPGILRPSGRQARIKDVIFVRPNFRMGPFGFLALDILSKSTHPPSSGNYGLSDIIAALKWIKLNIAHFGGDANSITLLGHRAGATLVSALVTSPLMKDLYSKAWVSSSAAIFPGRPLAESERRNQAFLDLIQCGDVECLRNANADTVLDAIPDTWRYYPADLPSIDENTTARHEWLVLDGEILRQHPADVWKTIKDEVTPPKLVIGTTAHESHNEKLYLKYDEWTPEIVKKYIDDSKIGALNLTEEAIQRYNLTYQGLVAMISDIRTICPLLTIARSQPSVPFYVVTHPDPKTNLADVDADVQSILGRYEPHTTQQRRYVASIQNLFYYYIAHGHVQQFDPRRRVIDLGQDPLPSEDYSHCNFWISKDIVPRYARID